MLQNLSDHVKNCLERAEEAGRRAKETGDPVRNADFLNLEKSWRVLARSFEFVERLERLLHNYSTNRALEWQPIATAPFDRDLELAIFGGEVPHALVFPSRRVLGGWIDAESKERLDLHPTHWREWVNMFSTEWQSISTAPSDCDLELAVIDDEGPHALIFPCRRTPDGWISTGTKKLIDVRPTHWRKWGQGT
jgi:hypothetical protein